MFCSPPARGALALSAVLVLSACNLDDVESAVDPNAAPPGAVDLRVQLDAPPFGYQVSTQAHLVKAGEELTTCDLVRVDPVGDERLVWLGEFESVSSQHTHHMNMNAGLFSFFDAYLGPNAAAKSLGVELGQHDCKDLGDLMETQGAQTVYPSQREHQVGALPAGVGVPLVVPVVFVVEHHYINTSDEDVWVDARINLGRIPEDSVEHVATGFFGIHPKIDIPPQGGTISARTCTISKPVTMFAISSHSHERGDCFTMNMYDRETSAIVDEPFFVNKDWESPPIMFTDQYETLPAGLPRTMMPGDGVHWACHYDNPEDRRVTNGGGSADDEMCIFVAVGYPNTLTVDDVKRAVADPLEFFNNEGDKLDEAFVRCDHIQAGSPWPATETELDSRPTACDAWPATGDLP